MKPSVACPGRLSEINDLSQLPLTAFCRLGKIGKHSEFWENNYHYRVGSQNDEGNLSKSEKHADGGLCRRKERGASTW